MNAERDELVQIIWDGAVADRVKDGNAPRQVPVVRPKVEAMADAILAAGYGKSSDRRPSVVTDAANRVAYFLNWHQGDNDIAAAFPSGPSLYASDLQVILTELKAGALQDSINAAHERQQWAQQGVFMRKRGECPPRMEGDKPHCPDCSGVVGETGIVW